MKKILFSEINKKLIQCQFSRSCLLNDADLEVYYKRHAWDGGYGYGHGFDGAREEFYSDQSEMFSYLYELIKALQVKDCIIAPLSSYQYFEEWLNLRENDIYQEIAGILRENKIRHKMQSGIELHFFQEFDIVKRFVEGGFRYISCAYLFFSECNLIIMPTHHMGYLLYINSNDSVHEHARKLAKYNENLGLLEKKRIANK